MKRRFLNQALPAFAVTLAIAGAFAAQSINNRAVLAKTGWINSPTPCAQSRQCDTDGSVFCTIKVGSVTHQAYGKLTGSSDCTQILYMPAQP